MQPATPNLKMTYRLVSVRDIDFSFTSSQTRGVKLNESKISIAYAWSVEPDTEDKTLNFLIAVTFLDNEEGKVNFPIINYYNETKFRLENFDEVITIINKDSINIPDAFVEQFLSISISTMRGILYDKIARSEYSHLIMPAATPEFIKGLIQNAKDKAAKINEAVAKK